MDFTLSKQQQMVQKLSLIHILDQEKEDDAERDGPKPGKHPVKRGLDVRFVVDHGKLHSRRGLQDALRR